MRVSIIMATYNNPDWLEKALWGYAVQTVRDFEIVVADDGSTAETAARLEAMRQATDLTIRHVWHADDGFRKNVILNKAIVASDAGYLIFTDGDCIPRRDFVQAHLRAAQSGCYLSGGYYKLPLHVSRMITSDDIRSNVIFNAAWQLKAGTPFNPRLSKFHLGETLAAFCNHYSTTLATFNGMNSSAWREDVLRVNGFDERMSYGGEDREFGQRLENAGVRPLQIRYSALCLHLDHNRGYRTDDDVAANRKINRETREAGTTWTPYGIEQTVAAAK